MIDFSNAYHGTVIVGGLVIPDSVMKFVTVATIAFPKYCPNGVASKTRSKIIITETIISPYSPINSFMLFLPSSFLSLFQLPDNVSWLLIFILNLNT